MKTRISKMLALVLTVTMLMCCLTGCEELSYREAVQRYNAHQYEKAAELFYELGDYEDSKALFTSSHYWAAMELMEAGDYAAAWPRFHKLGTYNDSADRAAECKYQMAIAAFESAEYDTAERFFLESPDYRLTQEYLRQLHWQRFYDYICANGEETDGISTVVQEAGERTVRFTADAGNLLITASWSKNMGYTFRDDLQLTISRESTEASFTASSSFTMAIGDQQIGSEQTGSGTVALSPYTPGMALALDRFAMTGTDNLGNSLDSQDIANCTMGDTMVKNMSAIWEAFPIVLAQSGTEAFF